MKSPTFALKPGTRVLTHPTLDQDPPCQNWQYRKPNVLGKITSVIGGSGGDVYFVEHDDDQTRAPYCYTEFELAPRAKTPKRKAKKEKAPVGRTRFDRDFDIE